MSCQDMEVDDDESLEEMGSVPSAVSDSAGWHEPLRVKHMCDKESFKFFDIAFILVEDGGRPHTINLCRQCCDCKRQNVAKQKMTSALWEDMELNGSVDVWETLSETGRSSNGGKEGKERPEYGRTQ